MLASEAITIVQRELGFRRDLQAEIISVMNSERRMLERHTTLPFFLLTGETSLPVTAGNSFVTLPIDFIRLANEEELFEYNANRSPEYRALERDTGGYLKGLKQEIGQPEAFDLSGLTLRIFPEPDVAYELRLRYYRSGTEITQAPDIETEWLKYEPDLLIYQTANRLAGNLGDSTRMQELAARAQAERQRYYNEMEARIHEGSRYIIGGDD